MPAVAVIQGGLALLNVTWRKGHVDDFRLVKLEILALQEVGLKPEN